MVDPPPVDWASGENKLCEHYVHVGRSPGILFLPCFGTSLSRAPDDWRLLLH